MALGDSDSDSSAVCFYRRRVLSCLLQRESGALPPKRFARRVTASEDFVYSLGINKKLEGHRGCVNSVSFNGDGSIILSGSDDQMVSLWTWEKAATKLSFHSGHSDNILNAQFMPCSDDQSIITCACDGEVRHFQLMDGCCAARRMLFKSQLPIHKMATEPGNPHTFYSCGEDGAVLHFDLRTKLATTLFKCSPLYHDAAESTIRLYTIALDPRSPSYFAIAGSDEYARIYDTRKCNLDGSSSSGQPTTILCPPNLIKDNQDGITGLAFSQSSELLVSYSFDNIYLFPKHQGPLTSTIETIPAYELKDGGDDRYKRQLLRSCTSSPEEAYVPKVFYGHQNRDTVKGVSFLGPNCEYVASGSDCGYIYIWRKEDGQIVRGMKADSSIVNCVEQDPTASVYASCGIDNDIKIWMPGGNESPATYNISQEGPSYWMSDSSSSGDMDYIFDDGDIIGAGTSIDSDDSNDGNSSTKEDGSESDGAVSDSAFG